MMRGRSGETLCNQSTTQKLREILFSLCIPRSVKYLGRLGPNKSGTCPARILRGF